MWKSLLPGLAIVALLGSAPASAADTTFSNASVKPKPFDLHDYFTFDATVFYSGASVTGMGSPYQPTTDGYDDPENRTFFQTRFRPQYKITPDIVIGPVLEWYYYPNFGGDYKFGDIFIRAAHKKLVDTPQFKMFGEVRIYFPSTDSSIDGDMIVSGRLYHDNTYMFKGTNLTLGYEQLIRGWSYGSSVKDGKPLVYWWWAPYLNYDFSSVWSAKIELDGGLTSAIGKTELAPDVTHFRLGFGWQPSPSIAFGPHLYVPTSDFSWSASVFNLEAWVKFF